ncbi:MAG: TM2 domain-containing protein, partial [Desulfuromonadales bacterium]
RRCRCLARPFTAAPSDARVDRHADLRFTAGPLDYNLAWILLTFLGLFGVHRMYMGKWLTGILYLLTGGLFGIGYIYDYWTLNDQLSQLNTAERT